MSLAAIDGDPGNLLIINFLRADTNLFSTDHAKLLSQDVVLLLKHFCFRLTAGPR